MRQHASPRVHRHKVHLCACPGIEVRQPGCAIGLNPQLGVQGLKAGIHQYQVRERGVIPNQRKLFLD